MLPSISKPFIYRAGWCWSIKFPDYYFPILLNNCKEVRDRIKAWLLAGKLTNEKS